MTAIHFEHGLGDAANFAHLVALAVASGQKISVKCTPDKAPLFRAAGAEIVSDAKAGHGWGHPGKAPPRSFTDAWKSNKVGHNLRAAPLILPGNPEEIWEAVKRVELNLDAQVTKEHLAAVQPLIEGPPYLLIHTKGNTSPAWKNYDDSRLTQLCQILLDRASWHLILLDWDKRVPHLHSHRLRHMPKHLPRLGLLELYVVMQAADAVIGVDSGPLHFARFTQTPALGLWTKNLPWHYALPRENTLHLVAAKEIAPYRRDEFNVVGADSPEEVAGWIERLVAPELHPVPGRNAFLLSLLDNLKKGSRTAHGAHVDRHRTFHEAFKRLNSKRRAIFIVETGCIRAEEDWSAGYSTYLLGAFLAHRGAGKLVSVDRDASRLEFAKQHTPYPTEFVCADSVTWLKNELPKLPAIDLIYLDSLDVGEPHCAAHGLAEAQAAAPCLQPGGLLLLDDTFWRDGGWFGKGALAVPWLLTQGFDLVLSGYQTLLEKKG